MEQLQQQENKSFLYSKKVIIWSAVIYLLYFGVLAFFLHFKWVTILSFILLVVSPLLLVITIVSIVYWIKNSKKQKEESVFDKKAKLNATTVTEWAKDYLMNECADNVVVEEKRVIKSGKYPNITSICYLKMIGKQTSKTYNFFINLIEPEESHTLRIGYLGEEEITKEVMNLSYAPYREPKRFIRREGVEGTKTEIEEDIIKPNIEEEIDLQGEEAD